MNSVYYLSLRAYEHFEEDVHFLVYLIAISSVVFGWLVAFKYPNAFFTIRKWLQFPAVLILGGGFAYGWGLECAVVEFNIYCYDVMLSNLPETYCARLGHLPEVAKTLWIFCIAITVCLQAPRAVEFWRRRNQARIVGL